MPKDFIIPLNKFSQAENDEIVLLVEGLFERGAPFETEEDLELPLRLVSCNVTVDESSGEPTGSTSFIFENNKYQTNALKVILNGDDIEAEIASGSETLSVMPDTKNCESGEHRLMLARLLSIGTKLVETADAVGHMTGETDDNEESQQTIDEIEERMDSPQTTSVGDQKSSEPDDEEEEK